MRRLVVRLVIPIVTTIAVVGAAAPAGAVSSKVENACRDDYFRHCSAYAVGSTSLRNCMQSKANQLSRSCINALVDAGYIDRRRLRRAGN